MCELVEMDRVLEYMRHSLHYQPATERAKAPIKSLHWWDDEGLIAGKYDKNRFVESLVDHSADQYDGPVGSNPRTWDCLCLGASNHSRPSTEGRKFGRILKGERTLDDEEGDEDVGGGS